MAGLIVVGVDGSVPSTAAVEWAAEDAALRDAELRLVYVREPWAEENPFHRSSDMRESLLRHYQEVLEQAAARARERAPRVTVTTELLAGEVVDELRDQAARADELVLGSRGMGGFAGMILGSVGLGLAGRVDRPVVIIRRPVQSVSGEIVVGIDGSPQADAALAYAFEEARLRDARVNAVHVWQVPAAAPYGVAYPGLLDDVRDAAVDTARRQLAPWRDKYPTVEVVETIVSGHPTPVLAEASRTADLVVVGSHGRGMIGSVLLGSVSHGLLHRAHSPVAVVGSRKEEP